VDNKPEMMVLMVQKEVAERIIAKPGQMSLLAVSVQFYTDARIAGEVAKESFWPKPKVDSAIVHLTRLRHPLLSKEREMSEAEKKFFRLVRAGFSAKRKQLQGNLKKELKVEKDDIRKILVECDLKETVRAQELSLEDWKRIFLVMDGRNML